MKIRRAFTITEILMAIGLLTFVLAIGGEVFKATVQLSAESARSVDRSARTDAVLFRLRQDVWACDDITIENPQTVRLHIPDQDSITWQFTPDGAATRTANSSPVWKCDSVATGWSMQRQGVCLLIQDAARPYPGQVRLPSQLLLEKTIYRGARAEHGGKGEEFSSAFSAPSSEAGGKSESPDESKRIRS